jgi:hypothetical protein
MVWAFKDGEAAGGIAQFAVPPLPSPPPPGPGNADNVHYVK